jgi:Ca2+-binding RTX toxin-like protein
MANYTITNDWSHVRGTNDSDHFDCQHDVQGASILGLGGSEDSYTGGFLDYSTIDGGDGYDNFEFENCHGNLLIGGTDGVGDRMFLHFGIGNTLLGGGGNDWFAVSVYNVNVPSLTNTLDGGGGDDFVGVTGDSNALYGGTGIDTVYAAGNNNFLFGGSNINTAAKWEVLFVNGNQNYADGGEGDDQVYAQAGEKNFLLGGNGNDWVGSNGQLSTLDGGAGDDFVGATGGLNTLIGGLGKDLLYAAGSVNVLAGGDDIDWLGVSGNFNVLSGGAGNDTIGATGNSNVISGGAGDDRITLGSGAQGDVIEFGFGDGRDTIVGFLPGPSVANAIRIEGFGLADLAHLLPYMKIVGSDTVITLGGDVITIANVNNLNSFNANDFQFVG